MAFDPEKVQSVPPQIFNEYNQTYNAVSRIDYDQLLKLYRENRWGMSDAAKEIAQLREKTSAPVQGSTWQLAPMSHRIIQVCFDMQRVHNLTAEKMLAGMAIALAEALDNSEKTVLGYVNHSLPAPMIMCQDCPLREYVNKKDGLPPKR